MQVYGCTMGTLAQEIIYGTWGFAIKPAQIDLGTIVTAAKVACGPWRKPMQVYGCTMADVAPGGDLLESFPYNLHRSNSDGRVTQDQTAYWSWIVIDAHPFQSWLNRSSRIPFWSRKCMHHVRRSLHCNANIIFWKDFCSNELFGDRVSL